jgi:heat shock protein HslJ
MRLVTTIIMLAVLGITIAGCSRDEPDQAPAADTAPETMPPAPEPTEPVADDQLVYSELAGTSWQLVGIQSMDDTYFAPDDGSMYTLTFGEDGRAMVFADCNRGSGVYISKSPGQLTFGPIATTMMACPEGSLHDKFLAQFEWVRSYVLEGGNLFLATMADGAIIEFEPAPASQE